MGRNGLPNRYTDLTVADRLIRSRTLFSREGALYEDAVRRCIRCEFDQVQDSLGDLDFKAAVFEKVILPLECDLKYFCGGKLPRVD